MKTDATGINDSKTYIQIEGKPVEVFTFEQSFVSAIGNKLLFHRDKVRSCASVGDYKNADHHKTVEGAVEDVLIIFNGLWNQYNTAVTI